MKHSKLEIALLTISVVFVVVMLIVPLAVGPGQFAGRRLGVLHPGPDDAVRPVGPAPDLAGYGRRRHRQYNLWPRRGLGYF